MKVIIQTPTPDIEASRQFYSKLGFDLFESKNRILYNEGKILIHINPDKTARPGIQLLKPSWNKEAALLEPSVPLKKIEGGYLLTGPSGVWIYLLETEEEVGDLSGRTSSTTLGNYAGISLETVDMNRSSTFWKILGFQKSMGDESQGWMSCVSEDQTTISLMGPNLCPHLFYNPSLTFFNGKNNPAIINKIRALDIPITQEITHFNKEGIVDNIIIRDPGGLGFFIFNDG